MNLNGDDTPQNFSDDFNGLNDENLKGVYNVEEMNEQQEIDQKNKIKLQIVEEEKIIFEQYDKEDKRKLQTSISFYADILYNELKKENSIKRNVLACILSSLGFAIAFGAMMVLCVFELLPGVVEILMVALGVAAIAFVGISEINAFKIADKNMENIKEQNKKGDRKQKSPVKNICATIFSGLGGAGLFGGFMAISILIFTEEILPLFAVALISFAVYACAMALFNIAFYNGSKAANIMIDNYFLKKAKKEIEQEQNKGNEGKSSLFSRSDSEMSLSSIDQEIVDENPVPLRKPNNPNKAKDD